MKLPHLRLKLAKCNKVASKVSLFMTNHSLYITIITNFFFAPCCRVFVLRTQQTIKNMDFSSNKKDIKITNFMPYFCAVEKAIIKRVKLLTNIQGDSPYTFFPRNFYHLTYSKYLYTRAHLLHTYTFTHLHNHWKFDIAPPAESSHFT